MSTNAPDFDPNDFLIESIIGLTKLFVRDFLQEHGLPVSGTKADFQDRLQEALGDGSIDQDDLIEVLDRVAPWSKQHVYLFDGPDQIPAQFTAEARFAAHLGQHEVADLLNGIPLVLPDELTLSAIAYDGQRLTITAIRRRDYTMREPELDDSAETDEGQRVELRAYIHGTTRGTVIFEWNFTTNKAMLQITELPSGVKYEDVRAEFRTLVTGWLDFGLFRPLSIRNAVARLHELEEQRHAEARSHGIQYRTMQGRTLIGRSATAATSVLGENVIDDALRNVRQQGVGHSGNFFWLPRTESPRRGNCLSREIHVLLIAEKGRVSFTTNNIEEEVRYVLSRVRTLSR